MPRAIGFDKDLVLEQICHIFWEYGYSRTSMRTVSDATGLNPGSLYNHFGNKQQMFLTVCDYYYRNLTAEINANLAGDQLAEEMLNAFFTNISRQQHARGCLLVNTLMECSQEPHIQSHIAAMFSGFEEMFYWIIVKGQKQGSIRPGLQARAEAKFLVNTYYGLRVQSLTDISESELSELIEHQLQRLT